MLTQLLVRLPDNLVGRFERMVPEGQRSAFIQSLLEAALPEAGDAADPLYLAALTVEGDESLAADMADWQAATGGMAPATGVTGRGAP